MTKLTALDKVSVEKLTRDIEAALAAVGEKYGVKITRNGGKFDSAGADLKLKVRVLNAAPAAVNNSRQAQAFRLYAPLEGISADALGKTIRLSQLGLCKIVGWNTRASRMPIMLETATGAAAKCSAACLVREFPAKKVA